MMIRYLYEEKLEIQVWFSNDCDSLAVRPSSVDTIIGSVYIPLTELLSKGGHIRYV